MEYRIFIKDKDGRKVQLNKKPVREEKKNALVESLGKQERWFAVDEVPDYLWHCPKVVFDMQRIPDAIEATKEGKDLPGVIYTCADENEVSEPGNLVRVKCTNGIRVGYVVTVVYGTFNQIIALKNKIGYKHLSPVIDVITNFSQTTTMKDVVVIPNSIKKPAKSLGRLCDAYLNGEEIEEEE